MIVNIIIIPHYASTFRSVGLPEVSQTIERYQALLAIARWHLFNGGPSIIEYLNDANRLADGDWQLILKLRDEGTVNRLDLRGLVGRRGKGYQVIERIVVSEWVILRSLGTTSRTRRRVPLMWEKITRRFERFGIK